MEPSRFAGKIMALKIAYSLVITPIPMVYGTYNYSIHGVYKPTYNWGAPPCRCLRIRKRFEWGYWGLTFVEIVSFWG